MEGRAGGGAERVGLVEAQLDLWVEFAEEGAEAPAGEEIDVRCFEHVPGRGEVLPEVGEQLAVGDGDEEAARRDAADFGEEGAGLGDVLEDFEAEGGVEGGVGEGERAAVHVAVREAEAGELGAVGGANFGADPVEAVGEEGTAVGAEAAADIDEARGRGREVAAEERGELGAAFGLRGADGEDVVVALDGGGAFVEEDAEVVGAVVVRDGLSGAVGEGRGERAVAEPGAEDERERGGRSGGSGGGEGRGAGEGGVVCEEFETAEGGGGEGEGGVDVGARVEGGGATEEWGGGIGAEVEFDGGDGGVVGAEVEPTADGEAERIDGRRREGFVEVGGHEGGGVFHRGSPGGEPQPRDRSRSEPLTGTDEH